MPVWGGQAHLPDQQRFRGSGCGVCMFCVGWWFSILRSVVAVRYVLPGVVHFVGVVARAVTNDAKRETVNKEDITKSKAENKKDDEKSKAEDRKDDTKSRTEGKKDGVDSKEDNKLARCISFSTASFRPMEIPSCCGV